MTLIFTHADLLHQMQWTDSMKRPLGVILLVVASITYAQGLLPVGGDYAIMAGMLVAVLTPGNYGSIVLAL